MLQCKTVKVLIKGIFIIGSGTRSSVDRLYMYTGITDFLYTRNFTFKLIVFKLSYLRNKAVYFAATCIISVK